MNQGNSELRNFLFFLNEAHPLSIEDSLSGAFASLSSWPDVTRMIKTAREQDPFVKSIKRVQLYIHVPFCGRLCTFCHCARSLLRRREEAENYIDVLKRQIMDLSSAYLGMTADTLCFGGGTPSILNEKQIETILDAVDEAFPDPRRKVLFEINPSSWSAGKLNVLVNRGLSRLSIGVQSLDQKVLKRVSRPQTRKKVLWCLRTAWKAKVPYVNVDLMAGLPGQTVEGFKDDLNVILGEGANIVHVYPYSDVSLIEFRGSTQVAVDFFKRRDTMMKLAAAMLNKAGFSRKGLGAYTRDGQGEEHQEEAYSTLESAVAGFGPHAKGQFPGAVFYRSGTLGPANTFPSVTVSSQSFHHAMAHYAVIGMLCGLNKKVFAKRFGVSLDKHFAGGLKFLKNAGIIEDVNGTWKFAGKWEVRRVREYVALSRILFGHDVILRLMDRFGSQYDSQKDYSKGHSLLKVYGNSWLMTLYYRMGV